MLSLKIFKKKNAFRALLTDKFGFTQAYEFALVEQLEHIMGPTDDEKAEKLMRALMTEGNNLFDRILIREGEQAVLTHCRALGYFGGLKDILLNAAEIAKYL